MISKIQDDYIRFLRSDKLQFGVITNEGPMQSTTKQALQQGVAAHREGNLKEAERFYRAILQSQPKHPDANHNLGLIVISTDQSAAALTLFKTALESNPKVEQFWFSYIDALIKTKQIDNAKRVIEQGRQQGIDGEKLKGLEAQLMVGAPVKESPSIKRKLTLSKKRKKFAVGKKKKKETNVGSPIQQEIDNLLGLYQSGLFDDAEKLALSMTEEFPEHPFGWSILGATFGQNGRTDDALQASRQAVKLAPQNSGAHSNFGVLLDRLGRFGEAEVSFRQAIALNPSSAEVHNNLAITLQKEGRLDEAELSVRKALALKPNYGEAYYILGKALQDQDRLDETEAAYRRAVELKGDLVDAHSNLGVALHKLGKRDAAIESLAVALKMRSDIADLFNLGVMLEGTTFKKPMPHLIDFVCQLLEKETLVRPAAISDAVISLLKFDPIIKSALEKHAAGNLAQAFKEIISDLANVPLLLILMKTCPLSNLEFEMLFKDIRSEILRNITQVKNNSKILDFQIALAAQCFTNEYLYDQADVENEALIDLENLVEAKIAGDEKPSLEELACLASYKRLYDYSWGRLIILPAQMGELYLRQVIEPEEEKNLRSQILQLKEVTDEVSSKVKRQYEKNPYPRWIKLRLPLSPKPISNIPKRASLRLINSDITEIPAPKILVAGCGTGQHSISTASEIENSQVLAIDLSLSSLAYAKRKTEELGILNIEYMQADILDLGGLNREFDIIESAGVLHHMDDPMAGWKVLADCLKIGGLMKIGLYSALARQHIAKVRKEIAQLSIGSSDNDMRTFRQNLINSSEEHHKAISLFKDFYSLSSYRDLVFHEQEHTFTIPKIQKCLDQLGLVFCGFENKEAVNSFRSKNILKPALYDTQEWRSFEEENPNIFSGMYQFWCQKI